MGYIEIIRPDGTGFSTKNSEELEFEQFDRCDKCGEWKSITNGRKYEQGGEFIMWWCAECR